MSTSQSRPILIEASWKVIFGHHILPACCDPGSSDIGKEQAQGSKRQHARYLMPNDCGSGYVHEVKRRDTYSRRCAMFADADPAKSKHD